MNVVCVRIWSAVAAVGLAAGLEAAPPQDHAELFTETVSIYADDFSGDSLNTTFWEVRQNTTWKIEGGVLTGSESAADFQARKIAAGDRSHAGLKPVIWLKGVPEQFVLSLRVRYDAAGYQRGFPLIDLGHHIHTLIFAADATTLRIKKNVQTVTVAEPRFSLNQWHELTIELRKGTLLVSIDGNRHRFDSPEIDMAGQAQIDFKGVDGGTCQIDQVRLWKGL